MEKCESKNLVRSIFKDQEIPIECNIVGSIPNWLNGTLFRNGPGRYRFNDKIYNHIFDGMACVNKFQIKNGKVFFSNKLLETNVLKKNLTNVNNLEASIGTVDSSSSLIDRFKWLFHSETRVKNDNNNINIVPFGFNQLYALSELSAIIRLDPKSLKIINRYNLTDYLSSTMTSISHPHIEEDGSWISVGMRSGLKGIIYDIIRFKYSDVDNACINVSSIANIPSSNLNSSSYFHSFGLSQNYIIFLEQSLKIDFKSMIWNIFINKPTTAGLIIDKSFKTKIHLIDRKTNKKLDINFYTDPQFAFHIINSFETHPEDPTKNELFIDLCSYNVNEFCIDDFNYDENDEEQMHKLFCKSKCYPRRIHVPIKINETKNKDVYCVIKDIAKACFELPSIDYKKYNTKPYKFAYGIGTYHAPYSIIKLNVSIDNDVKEAIIDKKKNRVLVPTEPIFIRSPNGIDEDDGILLTIVLGDYNDFLIILDAKTMNEIARAELPENVKATFTFHGFFADTETYKF